MHDPEPRPDGHHGPPHKWDHPFWPVHVIDEAIILYVLIGLIITLAVLKPFHLHGPADPLNTPMAIKPEWYFLPVYQFLKYVPKTVGVLGCGVFFVAMFLWPFIDGLMYRRLGHRKVSTFVGWAVLVFITTLLLLGKVCETKMTIGGRTYEFDYKGVPHLVTNAGGPAE